MAVTAWRIWLCRNSLVFEGKFAHPNAIYNEAVISLEEFQRCNLKELDTYQQDSGNNRNAELSWSPPLLV
jgi:hypothetical protein